MEASQPVADRRLALRGWRILAIPGSVSADVAGTASETVVSRVKDVDPGLGVQVCRPSQHDGCAEGMERK